MKEILRILQEWFARDHTRLSLFIGIFFAGLAGYSLGILRGSSIERVPLVMNVNPPQEISTTASPEFTAPAGSIRTTPSVTQEKTGVCLFVGSRNSTLYHLPTCASAKRIKESNRVCFASKEDATEKGYRPGCLK